MTTTPLLPSSPLYYCVDLLIEQLWEQSLKLEEQYYNNPSEDLLMQFAITVTVIQYWETVSLQIQMEGRR